MEQKEKSVFSAHLFAVNLLEKLVEFFKGLLTEEFLDFCIVWLTRIGHFGIIVAAGLGFLLSLIVAAKFNKFNIFGMGFLWVILLFVIQYTAHKFGSAGETMIKNNPSRLSSKTFLDCFGFLTLIGGVAVFILALIDLINGRPFVSFLAGVGGFVFLEFVALVAFNFKTVNVEIVEDNSAGQEALGVVTFLIKTLMKLVPILFGAFIVLGVVNLFIYGLKLFGEGAPFAWQVIAQGVAPQIIYAALLPFLSYLFFILAYLLIDMIRAILSLLDGKKK